MIRPDAAFFGLTVDTSPLSFFFFHSCRIIALITLSFRPTEKGSELETHSSRVSRVRSRADDGDSAKKRDIFLLFALPFGGVCTQGPVL